MTTTPAVKERPLLFKADMVRAILNGTKTQTRRLLKPQPEPRPDSSGGGHWWSCKQVRAMVGVEDFLCSEEDSSIAGCFCPYGAPGERIWVKETWATYTSLSHVKPRNLAAGFPCEFRAGGCSIGGRDKLVEHGKWRPSIFMPRVASRILLEVTGVRVERVQDISEEEALAEGIEFRGGYYLSTIHPVKGTLRCWADPKMAFEKLWDSINMKDFPWKSNPWVWVVEFKVIKPAGVMG